MEFNGTIIGGCLSLSSVQTAMRERFLHSQKDGTLVRETLKKIGKPKSQKQVKTHFGLVVEMIRLRLKDMGVDVCGVPVNQEMVYDILKRACFGVGDNGETLGLSKMTSSQSSKAFDNCRTWAATQLQLVIPDPNPDWNKEKK